jgi:hypothetical protein
MDPLVSACSFVDHSTNDSHSQTSGSICLHQQIKEDLARQYGAHVIDTTRSTFTISYEQLYPVVVSPRAYVTVTLVTPDVT